MKKDPTKKNEVKRQIKVKSQTIVGTQQYINPQTGEILDFTVIEKNIPKDFNFHKIWLQDVLNVLDSFGNKKILVITNILKMMRNEDNTFSGSYREISTKSNVSLPTVNLVMNELIESNVIKKIATGTYQFNPNIIAKGGGHKRANLLISYNYADEPKQINNVKSIKQLNIFGGIDDINSKKEV